MKDIDFLPQKYRDHTAHKRAGLWQLLVVALLGGAVGAASVGQFVHRRAVRLQLDELQPQYAAVQAQAALLAQMQTDLTSETAAATLYAYLQTPWPRSRLVAALTSSAGSELRIERLHLVEASKASQVSAAVENPNAQPALQNLSPATRDLTAIRSEAAQRVATAEIVGVSPQAATIHEYLERLEQSPLIERAELVSLENVSVEGQSRQLRFTAQVQMRAAHGWGTPAAPSAAPASHTLTQTP